MLTLEDYAKALETISALTADYVSSANAAKANPNSEAKQEFQRKSLYTTMMFDILKSLDGIRRITHPPVNTPTDKPYTSRIYNPDNG